MLDLVIHKASGYGPEFPDRQICFSCALPTNTTEAQVRMKEDAIRLNKLFRDIMPSLTYELLCGAMLADLASEHFGSCLPKNMPTSEDSTDTKGQ